MPRLAAGARLAQRGASAMIDLSDGLASDAAQIARASGMRIELVLAALPLAHGVAEVAAGARSRRRRPSPPPQARTTSCASAWRRPCRHSLARTWRLTVVGRVCAGEPGARFVDYGRALSGYEHAF